MSRDQELAHIGKQHGANYSLRIIREARHANVPVSLLFAVVEQESNFSNVFGHDPTIFQGAGKVTKKRYLDYKAARKRTGKMQGVGPMQLTWYGFQDEADKLGGCWATRHNIRVGAQHLGKLLRQYNTRDALAIYNAGNAKSPQGRQYAAQVLRRRDKWHERLT